MTEKEKSWLSQIKLVADTREQMPFQFKNETVRGALQTGDYSVLGLEDRIAIERKETNDLINCLCHDRKRFQKELLRSKTLDYFAIVAECSYSSLVNGDFRSDMSPKSAIQTLLAFSVRYRLPVFFAENAAYGAMITESLLLKFAREYWKTYIALTKDI